MSSFEELMRKQNEAASDNDIAEAAKKSAPGVNANQGVKDERIWKPTFDKAGNSYSVIRFLPAPDSDVPWAKYYEHFFRGPSGKYFVEKCPTTLGKECFVCYQNKARWNSGAESDKRIASQRKRNLYYMSNIYVIRDQENPENEGKQFLYRYGAKIFEKLMSVIAPQFEDDKPMDPFNLLRGAALKLKARTVTVDGNSFPSYDMSEFATPEPFFGGDEKKLRAVFDNLYGLKEFIDPSNYLEFDEMKTKFLSVTGEGQEKMSSMSSLESRMRNEKSNDHEIPFGNSSIPEEKMESSSEDDDDMEYFRRLAAEA